MINTFAHAVYGIRVKDFELLPWFDGDVSDLNNGADDWLISEYGEDSAVPCYEVCEYWNNVDSSCILYMRSTRVQCGNSLRELQSLRLDATPDGAQEFLSFVERHAIEYIGDAQWYIELDSF